MVYSELTWAQKVVLKATYSYKSSHNGILDYRRHEAKEETLISDEEYTVAKGELMSLKLLDIRGAITPAGKSAIKDTPSLFSLRKYPFPYNTL